MNERANGIEHIGETHGIYTIIGIADTRDTYGRIMYKCKCNECGYIKYSIYSHVVKSRIAKKCRHVKKCGPYIVPMTHWKNARIGNIFTSMVQRCYKADDKSYRWYGLKGVSICDNWLNDPSSFEDWALNNGYNDDLSIDRIDSDNDYCPENCVWIPISENSRKTSNANFITVDGITMTGKQWAKKLQIGTNAINKSVRKYGACLTENLIHAMLIDPPNTKRRTPQQSWFDVYEIQIPK